MDFNRVVKYLAPINGDLNNVTELNIDLDPMSNQPSYIKLPLLKHQLMSINKMKSIEEGVKIESCVLFNKIKHEYPYLGEKHSTYNYYSASHRHKYSEEMVTMNTIFGIFGDHVGSGKTYVILGMIKEPIKYRNTYNISNITFKIDEKHHVYPPIVVVPHHILMQWKDIIKTQTTLSYMLYKDEKQLKDDNAFDVDLILLSANKYNDFQSHTKDKRFSRIFYDEADNTYISYCQKISANFYWFVTANYSNLSYEDKTYLMNPTQYFLPLTRPAKTRNQFIRNLIGTVNTQFLKYITFKNNYDFVVECYKLKEYNHIKITSNSDKIINILAGHVSDEVTRMICSGDIKEAIETIKLEECTSDNIIEIVCYNLVFELNGLNAYLAYVQQKRYSSANIKTEAIAKINKQIEKVNDSIESIKKNILESDLDPITYEEIENPVVLKCCKQVFDFESITVYILSKLNPLCPICKSPISKESMIYINDDKEEEEEEETKEEEEKYVYSEHSKIENLKYIYDNILQDKARLIVFSEFDGIYTSLKKIIPISLIKEIKGHSSTITNTLEWFKNTDSNEKRVIYLNAKHKGSGLNLQSCTDIILYHTMPNDMKIQGIGRAQRPGRTGILNVYEFEDQIEE